MKKFLASRPLWQRLLALAVIALASGILLRVLEPIGWLLLLLSLACAVWAIMGGFKKRETPNGPKRSIWKGLLSIGISFLAIVILMPSGGGLGETIKPLTAQEQAERAKKAEERAAIAAQEAQAQAAQEEKDRAAADAEAQAQAEAEASASAEAKRIEALASASAQAEAEKQAAEERAAASADAQAAESDRLRDLRENQPLLYVAEACKNLDKPLADYYTVNANGDKAFLTTLSSEDSGGTSALACVRLLLNWSQPFVAAISSTSALAGTRTWSENGYSYQWTYHPSSGLNMAITRD